MRAVNRMRILARRAACQPKSARRQLIVKLNAHLLSAQDFFQSG
jgi:hypothetical protein